MLIPAESFANIILSCIELFTESAMSMASLPLPFANIVLLITRLSLDINFIPLLFLLWFVTTILQFFIVILFTPVAFTPYPTFVFV